MTIKSTKHLLVALVVIVTVLAISYLVRSKPAPPTQPDEETTWNVRALALTPTDQPAELNLLGRTESTQRTLISSRVNTTVSETPALAGKHFQKGEVLLRLDAREVEVVYRQRTADVRELEALITEERLRHQSNLASLATEQKLVDLAEKSVNRQQRLAKNNVTSEERLDSAEITVQQQQLALVNRQLQVNNFPNRLAQLEARLERAKANLTLAELDMAQTELRAPFSGWVVALNVAVGNRVSIGAPLVELVADQSLEVRAEVPDLWVARLRQLVSRDFSNKEKYDAHARLFGETIPIRLDRISAAASMDTGGISAFFKTTQPGKLVLDKSVSITLQMPTEQSAFALPVSAFYDFDRIYTIDQEQRLVAHKVTRLGRFQDASGAEWILFRGDSLQTGQSAVTTQLPNAISGLRVNPTG